MSELSDYSENCDYLREKFKLDKSCSLYTMVNKAVEFIKDLDDENELSKLQDVEVEILEQTQDKPEDKPKGKNKNVRRKSS